MRRAVMAEPAVGHNDHGVVARHNASHGCWCGFRFTTEFSRRPRSRPRQYMPSMGLERSATRRRGRRTWVGERRVELSRLSVGVYLVPFDVSSEAYASL